MYSVNGRVLYYFYIVNKSYRVVLKSVKIQIRYIIHVIFLFMGFEIEWTPLIAHDSTSVTMTYKYGCSNQWEMGLRYAWRESPCAFKKCAVYTIKNELPMPPFIVLGLISARNQQWLAVDDLYWNTTITKPFLHTLLN